MIEPMFTVVKDGCFENKVLQLKSMMIRLIDQANYSSGADNGNGGSLIQSKNANEMKLRLIGAFERIL